LRIEENCRESENEHGYAEPHEDEGTLVRLGRRCGNADDERQTAKDTGQKSDHLSVPAETGRTDSQGVRSVAQPDTVHLRPNPRRRNAKNLYRSHPQTSV